jgi:hypothetical protein
MNLEDLRAFAEAVSQHQGPPPRVFQVPKDQRQWLGGPLKKRNFADNDQLNRLRRNFEFPALRAKSPLY